MSERWQQVKKIFNAALERPVGERSRYLAQACAGDEDLRAEVESLLAADSQADNVLLIPIGPAPFMDTIVPTTLAPGTRFGPYEIERLLGAGGMGEVYKARDTRLDRTVAMKVLPSRFARDPELRKRLHREARAISSLNHPHIRALYDIGEQDGLEFLVMEYLEGETLADRLGAGPLPLTEAVRYAQEMIGALAEAHQHGIVHRDLKPRNVMLAKSGTKLLDFGIAKVRGELAEDTGEGAAGLTAKGSVLGTLQYMAPEQLEGHQVDVRTDIFAFGLVVYEMVTGRKAFEATTETSLIVAILERDPTPLRAVQPLAPLWLETLVARCLAKRPADRWQSSVELLAQLAQDGSEAAALASMGREPAAGMEESPTQGATGLTESRPATGELASIAVLAFTNMSADKEQEYFCDGIAEELINALTKLSGLRVASRTSAFQFKGRAVEVSEIGRRLKVDTILEGSVRKAGNRLRVTARLVDTRSGYELWSERFDREMDDVFAVQDEIARAVAEGLRMQLTDEPVIAPTTRSVDAYHLYLKGRDYWTRRYSGFLHTAVECFEQAIAIDPGYALAHAGLADGYAVLGFWGYLPSREMMAKAEAAARRALMLDSALSEAHQSMGYVQAFFGWDAARAEDAFSQALRLNPRYAVAHGQRALLSICSGRPNRAVTEMEKAQVLDPLSPLLGWYLGIARYHARQYAQAVRECQRVLDLHPEFAVVLYHLSSALSAQGQHAAALEAARRLAALSKRQPYFLAHLGAMSGASGSRPAAEQVLAELLDRSRGEYVMPVGLANLYLAMGEDEQGLGLLEQAYEDRNGPLAFLATDPFYDRVRSDPRFDAIVRKIGVSALPRGMSTAPRSDAGGGLLTGAPRLDPS